MAKIFHPLGFVSFKMNLPIFSKLADGEKFDFETLADNLDDTLKYWDYWWENRDLSVISRPEIILDSEPILVETISKDTVDLVSFSERFHRFLSSVIKQSGLIEPKQNLDRTVFRQNLVKILKANSIYYPGRKHVVFSGGGYGSGKSSSFLYLGLSDKFAIPVRCLLGVDAFKPYIPEYNLIKSVRDGRASFTVQKECVFLSNLLFDSLINANRSFMWDSSMSNKAETLKRIEKANQEGYELTMVAVLTPLPLAITFAMRRAKKDRRFPHHQALPESHANFRKVFLDYIPLFDDVFIYANLRDEYPAKPELIARKFSKENELEVIREDVFNELTREKL